MRNVYDVLILTTAFFCLTGAPQPINLECLLTSNAALAIFSYACVVIPGDGDEDTLVCTVDGVAFEPCEFPIFVCKVFIHILLSLYY